MRFQLRVELTARRNNDAECPTLNDEPCGKHPMWILFAQRISPVCIQNGCIWSDAMRCIFSWITNRCIWSDAVLVCTKSDQSDYKPMHMVRCDSYGPM